MVQTVVCMKWGTRYPPIYANNLWHMVRRNTRRPTRLVCLTDDASGLDPEIVALPLPSLKLPGDITNLPWRKLSLWAPVLPGLAGDVLFMDLDIVVTGSVDDFFDFQPQMTFCVIENWTQLGARIGNTSCFRFRVGAHPYIYEGVAKDPEHVRRTYVNEQIYISRTISEMAFWPAPWCVSFKHSLLPRWPMNFFRAAPLPEGTKVVCFTGKPDPDEARDGWSDRRLVKRLYKHVRPTPWIAEHWR
ncbi:MAG: hypothetical protein NW223_02795 [Hyphomicrobiaceae bacterium]|nr:hypothetical protein [Hyphomicrobiaceae bacterium]